MPDHGTTETDDLEPIYCGLCIYGSDVDVHGYDSQGPAYINPACAAHNP